MQNRLARSAVLGLVLNSILPSLSLAQQQQPVPTVTVVKAVSEDFTMKMRLPGRVKASTVAEVRPQVSGIIRERLFEEGVRVEAGQPLYKIEDDTYVAAVAAAKATVAQAQANFDLAARDAGRAEELLRARTGSEQRRDSAVATRDAGNAALQLSKAQLMSAEIELERTTIRASVSGVIGLSQTTTGALVGAQQANALATIRTLDPVYVDVTQSANDLMRWQGGSASETSNKQDVTLILPTGDTFKHKGQLRAAEPQVEPTTGMITLRITVENPDQTLLPGLYVEVELPQAKAEGAFLIPQNAVMRDASGGAYAWVVEDGKIAVRNLTVLTTSENRWVVTGGLKEGDQIVTTGFQKVAPGAQVEIAQDEAKPGAPAVQPTEGD